MRIAAKTCPAEFCLDTGHKGFASWETWNVATLIESSEDLYSMACNYAYRVSPFEALRDDLRKLGVISRDGTDSDSGFFFSPHVAIEEINDMIETLAREIDGPSIEVTRLLPADRSDLYDLR